MGYADPSQTGHGIHIRLRSRAFIISERPSWTEQQQKEQQKQQQQHPVMSTYAADSSTNSIEMNFKHKYDKEYNGIDSATVFSETNSKTAVQRRLGRTKHENLDRTLNSNPAREENMIINPATTICFVSIDAGMGSDLLTRRVLDRLDELKNQSSLLIPCTLENLSISGAHSHSGPGGFLQYALYQATSLGFSEEVLGTFVEGVVQSLIQAYNKIQPGSIEVAHGILLDGVSINRSPTSYLWNPENERNEYVQYGGDTDKDMVQLNFRSELSDEPLGLLNWFAVHPTSMNKTNTLISGDNKGYASYLSEKHFNGYGTLPGNGNFVAAFGSTNLGDVSPNIAGPRCIDTGESCDRNASACHGNAMLCIASGPGRTMKESTEIIGRKQYEHSMKLWSLSKDTLYRHRIIKNNTDDNQLQPQKLFLEGTVDFRHSIINMSALSVTLPNGDIVQTCPAALGYSVAAGTTDGPGDFPFVQGTNASNPFWDMLTGFLSIPSPEQIKCHAPKPILLNVGHVSVPYPWVPSIVPISIFQVGQLFILNVPGEFTTMAGRRLRKAVRETLIAGGVTDPQVTIAGLANTYSHYVTTFEEYSAQRYEAASTLYGPHTLSAYIQEFQRIANDLVRKWPSQTMSVPRDLSTKQISLIPPVFVDLIGLGYRFGSVTTDARDQYKVGQTVTVSFRSANPRNNQRIEGTFLTIDKMRDDSTWETLYVDGDWCTEFRWYGGVGHFGISFAEIAWDIPKESATGLYRVCHFGTQRTVRGVLLMFLFRIPGWVTSNVLGSRATDLVFQTFEFVATQFDLVRRFHRHLIETLRMQDFHGCSRTFLVHP